MRFLVCLLFLASACSPVYLPNSRSVPMLNSAGEVSIDGDFSSSGLNLNTGVAVSDHFVVILNGTFSDHENWSNSAHVYHRAAELGIGYYHYDSSSRFQVEFFYGYGMGEASAVSDELFLSSDIIESKGDYRKSFLQGNFGWKLDLVNLGGALRVSKIKFTDFETNADVVGFSTNSTFVEPVFFISVGKKLRFNAQVGFSLPVTQEPVFDYVPLHGAVGIGARLGGKKRL
ncbi:hypothetical protein E1176_13290 [Fulvivirga sp. RKSG066]|uniref:hypothetical protein n=1 Tax=Fulvivirga aurantia TaxID=2529383 RepID=UPI0012BC54C7|nr:hypothetical protein [Fulvivirga aurantia]MTI22000.1 hypothetical protein [Fulvivirga aurantia]